MTTLIIGNAASLVIYLCAVKKGIANYYSDENDGMSTWTFDRVTTVCNVKCNASSCCIMVLLQIVHNRIWSIPVLALTLWGAVMMSWNVDTEHSSCNTMPVENVCANWLFASTFFHV